MRGKGWLLLVLFLGLSLGGKTAQARGAFTLRPVIRFAPAIFGLDGGEKLIALPDQEGRDLGQITLDLLRMDRRGLVSRVGRYRFEIPGLRDRGLEVVNQPGEVPYVILPHGDQFLLVYELPLPRSGGGFPRAEPGLAALRLLSGGEVEGHSPVKIADLLAQLGIENNGYTQLVSMRPAEGGKAVELLLALMQNRFEGGELYLVRVDAENLQAEGRSQRVGWLCSTCTASFSGRWVVIVQQESPLAMVVDPEEGKEERVVFDNLLSGTNLGLVYQIVPVIPLWPPSSFGEGWVGEIPYAREIWIRQGGKWHLTSQGQREMVVATFNSRGEFERLTRLPPSWKMGRSFDPNWLIFYNRFSSEVALVSRRGVVRSLGIDEEGRLSDGVIPKWLENRLKLLSYRPLDLTAYSFSRQAKKTAPPGTGTLFLLPGPNVVGVAVRLNFGQELRVKVMDYGGNPLYEVSFREGELIDPEEFRPEAADPKHYQAQSYPAEYLPTRQGLYALIPLTWTKRGPKSYETKELNPPPDAFYRLALVHISPAGKAQLVSLLNLEDAVRKGGLVLENGVAEVAGDLLVVKVGSPNPGVKLFASATKKGIRSLVEIRLGKTIAGKRFFYQRELGETSEGLAPSLGRFSPSTVLCETWLASGKLGECVAEVPEGLPPLGNMVYSRLFPKQVEWLSDLRLEAPVFFQGWSGEQGEGGDSVPLFQYERQTSILAYSDEGFLGYLHVPSKLDYLEGKLRTDPAGLPSHRLFCRWGRDGAIRACVALPGLIELGALDPAGTGNFWLRLSSKERGLAVLMVDRRGRKGKLFFWDGTKIAEEDLLPPFVGYLLETIAGPVEWKPLPWAVFKLHPGEVPNYRELVREDSN